MTGWNFEKVIAGQENATQQVAEAAHFVAGPLPSMKEFVYNHINIKQ